MDGQPRRQQQWIDDYRLTVDIPQFNVNLHIEDFLDWISEVEKFFGAMEVSESKMVKLVAYKLKSCGAVWWDQLQRTRHKGKDEATPYYGYTLAPRLWIVFVTIVLELPQGFKSIFDYTAEFSKLSNCNNLNETEGQRVARCLIGLEPSTRKKIGLQVLWLWWKQIPWLSTPNWSRHNTTVSSFPMTNKVRGSKCQHLQINPRMLLTGVTIKQMKFN